MAADRAGLACADLRLTPNTSDMFRTLVIGYGNLDRQDDGVAYEVINALRQRLGQEPLSGEDTGLDRLGAQVDTVFVLQLAPELFDVLVDYDRVVFVDAHVRADVDSIHCTLVRPEYASATFTHHMTPAMILALLQALYHHEPQGFMVSVRGSSFDFERGLSTTTKALIAPAVELILPLLADPGTDGAETASWPMRLNPVEVTQQEKNR